MLLAGRFGCATMIRRERHRLSALLGGRTPHHNLSFMRRRPRPLPTFLAVYGLLYAAFGVQSPFLPALLSGRGLHAEEIGIVLAASTAIRVLAGPAVGHMADRQRRHTLTLCACSLVAAVAGLGYVTVRGFSGLLLVALVQAAMLAPIVPLSDALATTAARRSETGEGTPFQYGWLRAAGSAAFIVGTMLSGWRASGTGLASIVWFSGTLLGIGGAAALLLPKIPSAPTLSNHLSGSTTRDWASLLQIPAFRLLLIIAALVEGSHALHELVLGNPLACGWSRIACHQCPLVGVRVIGGAGLPSDRTAIGSPAYPRWGNGRGCGGGDRPLDRCGLHYIASHLGVRSAAAWVHIRTATLGSHAGDRAGSATPFGCNRTSHLRHTMHWAGHRPADAGFWGSLCADGRSRVSRHGRALSAGTPYVRAVALTGYSGVIPAARSDDRFGCNSGPSPLFAAELSLDGWTGLRGFNHPRRRPPSDGRPPVARGRSRHIRTGDKHVSPLKNLVTVSRQRLCTLPALPSEGYNRQTVSGFHASRDNARRDRRMTPLEQRDADRIQRDALRERGEEGARHRRATIRRITDIVWSAVIASAVTIIVVTSLGWLTTQAVVERAREQGAEGLVALRAVVCTVRFQQRPDAAAKLAEFKALPFGKKDTAIKKFIADEKLATMVGENAPAADAIDRCAYAINNLAS